LQKKIVFVSLMRGAPWAGCEELWSQTAVNLVEEGFAVSASILAWSPPHRRVLDMVDRGIDIWLRPRKYSLQKLAWNKLTSPKSSLETLDVQRLIEAKSPDLVVLSEGGAFPPMEMLESCIARRVPFVTIAEANCDFWWPTDEEAERYRKGFSAALRCYFVSEANRRLLEKQIGCELSNAEVVRNPFNVKFDFSPAWPNLGQDGELHFACVARLDPVPKGQDILFEALSGPSWMPRPWQLTLYGEGQRRKSLECLAQRLGISDRVIFAGFLPAEEIWARSHVLVMPSRFEGLPLAMVEAMLCGRPVVATDVAGHAEIIQDGVTGFLAESPTPSSLSLALERFWMRRAEAQAIGVAASKRIRELVPPEPARVFSGKLKEIIRRRPDSGSLRGLTKCPNYREGRAGKKRVVQCK
jgi:glycosyltransferase involved in cell wall biosynthesis